MTASCLPCCLLVPTSAKQLSSDPTAFHLAMLQTANRLLVARRDPLSLEHHLCVSLINN